MRARWIEPVEAIEAGKTTIGRGDAAPMRQGKCRQPCVGHEIAPDLSVGIHERRERRPHCVVHDHPPPPSRPPHRIHERHRVPGWRRVGIDARVGDNAEEACERALGDADLIRPIQKVGEPGGVTLMEWRLPPKGVHEDVDVGQDDQRAPSRSSAAQSASWSARSTSTVPSIAP